MVDGQREIRAADSDRQAAVARLRTALDEGRLDILEYDSRLVLAYQAVTYGDLADLFVDLPAPQHGATPAPVTPPPPPAAPTPEIIGTMPTWAKVLWTIWGSVLLINLTVWGLVSLSDFHLQYFWPMWLGVPTIVLAGISTAATAARRARLERQAARGSLPS